MGQQLALPANITDICEGRNKAIALWLGLYDQYHQITEEARRLCIGGYIGLSSGQDHGQFTRAFLRAGEIEERDRATGRISSSPERAEFERVATNEIDRRCWSALMKKLQFDQLLDEQARREFDEALRNMPPAFTVESCEATFGHIWINRREIYLRGIVNLFTKLDRRFRSHDGFKCLIQNYPD